MGSKKLIEAIAVTAELCGRQYTPAAAKALVMDLEGYPEESVMMALQRCRKEVKGFLSVADIISRIDDGRPGVEEAWAMMPRSESETVVWTQEMATAFGSVYRLLEEGDKVAARMAFKERYVALCAEAKDKRIPVKWNASLGHDVAGRAPALSAAVAAGKIENETAKALCYEYEEPEGTMLTLVSSALKKI